MSSSPSIVWFRHDLRLDDNPALLAAIRRDAAVVPVFIWPPEEEGDWAPGAASRWWLNQSLARLDAGLRDTGSRLILRKGGSLAELRRIVRETGAGAVYWNRRYEPAAVERDRAVERGLRADGIEVGVFDGCLLFPPEAVLKIDGTPYRVFTPFWKACLAKPAPDDPVPAPTRLSTNLRGPCGSVPLNALELEPRIDWAAGLRETWTPGDAGAAEALDRFLNDPVSHYDTGRDLPGVLGTSRLSPHLRFGEVSPRRVWRAIRLRADRDQRRRRGSSSGGPVVASGPGGSTGPDEFLRQLVWREFAYSIIFHFPHTANRPLRSEFERLPWRNDAAGLRAWQRGETGYPLVDAGMRELWRTGWMHNRVRMVVASFLVKHLRIHWLEGARWFWDTLVDADLANNTFGWQWTSGCGADAAPYFRVFNPTTQAEKFDPTGNYIRRWIPELRALPAPHLFHPWQVPPAELRKAGIILGETYPRPIVDHATAREQALEAYAQVRR